MTGSIIGDIVGSVFEFNNIKSKDFSFFDENKSFTDDSILTIATAEWLLNGGIVGEYYLKYAEEYPYPMGGYGSGFSSWIHQCKDGCLAPAYNSCGNGSAMRVAPVGWAFETLEETLDAAKRSAECTHNHPEGIKGAQATAHAIFMARHGSSVNDIRDMISQTYGYDLSMPVDEIRNKYGWDGIEGTGLSGATCQGSVPQAITCALEATSFEDAIRNAVSIGGDSDTIACITGGIAEALFGIPQDIIEKLKYYLPGNLYDIVTSFCDKYGNSVKETDNEIENTNNINQNSDIMAINEKIQQIVDRRKGLGEYQSQGFLKAIDDCSTHLTRIQEEVKNFSEFRDTLLESAKTGTGEYASYFKNDPDLENRIKEADPEHVLKHLETSITECTRLHTRFDRDTINISVIGRARQGKSCLLQAISGLQDSVIPASNGGDCTGTTSVICNEVGAHTAHADVIFYTKEEILKQVRKYIEEIGLHQGVVSFESIPNLQSVVDECVNNKFNGMTGQQQSLFFHFRKYVEHFNDYASLVSAGSVPAAENEIRSYVAQYDSNGNLTYKYLAVKEVCIYKEFHFAEAGRIVLVDTIGLGDTSLGIKDRMLNTLQNNSDAALMVRLPAANGDNWRVEDDELYDLILNKMGEEMLDKWLFLVLNSCEFLGNKNSTDAMINTIQTKNLHIADTFVINCADKDIVKNDLLVPVLEYLITNLETVDKELIENVNKQLRKCCQSYNTLYESVRGIINNSPAHKKGIETFGITKWGNIEGIIELELASIYAEYNDAQYSACTSVQKGVEEKKESLYSYVPALEWYEEEMKKMHNPQSVYSDGLDKIRPLISANFEDININTIQPLQEELKIRVAYMLHEFALWKNIPLETSSTEDCTLEWLECFAEEKLKNSFPHIYETIRFILSYEMSIADLLDYKVESALSTLDTAPGAPHFVPLDVAEAQRTGVYNDRIAMARFIWEATINLIPTVEEKMGKEFSLYNEIPSHSLYARIRKFREKFLSEATRNELRQFYIIHSTAIWADQYMQMHQAAQTYGKLHNWITQLSSSVAVGNKLIIKTN